MPITALILSWYLVLVLLNQELELVEILFFQDSLLPFRWMKEMNGKDNANRGGKNTVVKWIMQKYSADLYSRTLNRNVTKLETLGYYTLLSMDTRNQKKKKK